MITIHGEIALVGDYLLSNTPRENAPSVILCGSARHRMADATQCNYHPPVGTVFIIVGRNCMEREQRQPVPLPESRKVKLTLAQRKIVIALASGYTVALAGSPGIAYDVCVVLGTGSRMARVSLECLLGQGIIEEAGCELDRKPYRAYRELIFFQLTATGWDVAKRMKPQEIQGLSEVVQPLPLEISEVQTAVERYCTQFGREPLVEVHGPMVLVGDPCYEQVRVTAWLPVVAYDVTRNMFGVLPEPLEPLEPGIDADRLLWLAPDYYWYRRARFRLRPKLSEFISP